MKMGRPKKEPKDVRVRVLVMRLTDAEHRLLRETAERTGEPMIDWARRMLNDYARAYVSHI